MATKKTKTKKKTAKKPAKKAAKKTKKAGAKRKPNAAFMKPLTPSASLAAIVGAKPLPRTEVTKKVWQYIKKHGLQDTQQKRNIHADETLKAVVGGKKVINMFELTKFVSKHLS